MTAHPDATTWQSRADALWAEFDQHTEADFIQRIEALAAERPAGDALALFERACAQDAAGSETQAVALYQSALAAGLPGVARRRARIQLASSLRNVGAADEAVQMLRDELALPADALTGAVRAFLALALADVGREREGLMHSLTALAPLLPRYNRSLAAYAAALAPEPGARTTENQS